MWVADTDQSSEQINYFARERVIITLNKQLCPFLATVAFLDWE
jgi:hypothetical protein